MVRDFISRLLWNSQTYHDGSQRERVGRGDGIYMDLWACKTYRGPNFSTLYRLLPQHLLFFKKSTDQRDQQFDAANANTKIVHGFMLESNFSVQMCREHSRRELDRNFGVHEGCQKKNHLFLSLRCKTRSGYILSSRFSMFQALCWSEQ